MYQHVLIQHVLTKEDVKMQINAVASTYKKHNNNKNRIDITKCRQGNIRRNVINSKNTCFITLLNNSTVRLINPAKIELRRISMALLDNINKRLCSSLNFNQWKNTKSVIEWYKRIKQNIYINLSCSI